MIDLNKLNYFFANQAQSYFGNNIELKKSYEKLKANYARLKNKNQNIYLNNQEKYIYPITRLPGTLAAIKSSLENIFQQLPNFKPQNILDIGSGPGTALFACLDFFDHKFNYLGLEQDLNFIAQAQDALKYSTSGLTNKINFLQTQIPHTNLEQKYDLVICSYILSETPPSQLEKLILWAAKQATGILLIIDAGTPKIFSQIITTRDILLKINNTQLIAPCPHNLSCPLNHTNNFCHFSVRLERTKLLTQIKSGTSNYEDEKFSYLGFIINLEQNLKTKKYPRILSRPIKRSGHIIFDTCNPDGTVTRKIISKKDKLKFREHSKKTWGQNLIIN